MFLFSLFAFGTIGFWIASIILGFFIAAFVGSDRGSGATFTTIIALLFVDFVAGIPVFSLIAYHPLVTLICLVVYFLVGTVWAFIKWYLYVKEQYTYYQSIKPKDISEYIPQVKYHKSDILFWISYWPFSVLAFLVWDFVRKIGTAIYNQIAGRLQAISNGVFVK